MEASNACGASTRMQAVMAGQQISKVKVSHHHFREARP